MPLIPLLAWIACTGAPTTASSDSGRETDLTDANSDSGATSSALVCPPADTGDSGGSISGACCDTDPTLQLLGGEGAPEDLVEGGSLPLTYSPQYGWELQVYPKVCGTRDQGTLEVALRDVETGSTLAEDTDVTDLYQDADGSCCADTWLRYERLVLDDIPDSEGRDLAEALCGRAVLLSATMTDADGRTATETLQLIVSADEEAMGHPCGQDTSDTDTGSASRP